MNEKPNRWIPLATAGLGIVAALVATPLLFPTPALASGTAVPAGIAKLQPQATAASGVLTGNDADLARLGAVIVGIASVGAAALWLLRRVKGRPFLRRQGRTLEILDTLALGNQRSVAVARVYDRIFVLGLAKDNISLIQELREDESGVDMESVARRDRDVNTVAGTAPTFRSLLKKLTNPAAPAALAARDVEVNAAPRRASNRRVTIAELERQERSAGSHDAAELERVEELL